MAYVTFDTNRCLYCGRQVFVRERLVCVNRYTVLPDGTVAEDSREEIDRHADLDLVCPRCGVVEAGHWDPEGTKFECWTL